MIDLTGHLTTWHLALSSAEGPGQTVKPYCLSRLKLLTDNLIQIRIDQGIL